MIKMACFLMMVCACACTHGNNGPDSGPEGYVDVDIDSYDHDANPEDADGGGADGDAGDGEATLEADVDGDIEELPPLEWGPCDTTDWPAGYPLPPANTECTFIDVPGDHNAPTGPTLPLRVARHTSATGSDGRAVFFLEGGPGLSVVVTSGIYDEIMPGLADEFDLIYIDQRGVGGSGLLSCSPETPVTADEWIACAQAYPEVDLNTYLSKAVAQDLDVVRERLGYEEIYIFGVSYGTRVAFEYLRLFNDRVVAAVLDGVAPPPVDLFSDSVTADDRGVQLLIRDCSSDPACLDVSPNLEEDLETRRMTLRDTPREITISGTAYLETEYDYQGFLTHFIGASYWRYRVPRAIHQAVEGDNTLWNRLMSEAIGMRVTDSSGTEPASPPTPLLSRLRAIPMSPSLVAEMDSWGPNSKSRVVRMAMLCAEILPNSEGVDALNALLEEQTWAVTNIVEQADSCPEWPVDPLPLSEREYLTVDTRILMLSGEIDVNVNPSWAIAAASALPNATHLLVPYATHVTTYVPCIGQINTDFFTADGDISLVDTTCLENLTPPTWD